MRKQCSVCKISKDFLEFHKQKSRKDGICSECKSCFNKRAAAYRHTKDGLVTAIYGGQKRRSKKRGHIPPTYTKDELKEWLYSQKKFHKLFDNWKRLDFQKDYVPSIDRKNDYIGYTIDNIQLMTFFENRQKGYIDMIRGVNNKRSKPVLQYTENGCFIGEYYSTMEAERQTGIHQSNIVRCCNGDRKTESGFVWKYKTSKNKKDIKC